jgi:hypothetical protein
MKFIIWPVALLSLSRTFLYDPIELVSKFREGAQPIDGPPIEVLQTNDRHNEIGDDCRRKQPIE